jgi:hypothetical protein
MGGMNDAPIAPCERGNEKSPACPDAPQSQCDMTPGSGCAAMTCASAVFSGAAPAGVWLVSSHVPAPQGTPPELTSRAVKPEFPPPRA